jgi:hypothetical protein
VTGLIRRGIQSSVEKRVAWQEQQAALKRLEMAKEAGALERMSQRLDAGSLHLSTDVGTARCERDACTMIDSAQAKSREAWLTYRTNQELVEAKDKILSGPVLVPSRNAALKVTEKLESGKLLDRDGDALER